MTDIDPNLWLQLAKTYMQGITLPSKGQEGYLAYVNAEGDNLAYSPPVQDLPPIVLGDALKVLRVNATETAVEWVAGDGVWLPLAGGQMSGDIDMNGGEIKEAGSISTGTFPASLGQIRMTYGDTVRVRRGDGFGYSYIIKTEDHLIIGSDTPVDPAQTDMQVVWQAPSTHKWWSATAQLAALNSTDFVGKSGGGTHLGSVAHPWGDIYGQSLDLDGGDISDVGTVDGVDVSALAAEATATKTTLQDDDVLILPANSPGMLQFFTNVGTAPAGSVLFRSTSGINYVVLIAVCNPSNLTLSATALELTGTTGIDGNITISTFGTSVYVENRWGYAINFYHLMLK